MFHKHFSPAIAGSARRPAAGGSEQFLRVKRRMKLGKEEERRLKKTCRKCGHIWIARTEKPRSCPNCKSYSWDKKKEKKNP